MYKNNVCSGVNYKYIVFKLYILFKISRIFIVLKNKFNFNVYIFLFLNSLECYYFILPNVYIDFCFS